MNNGFYAIQHLAKAIFVNYFHAMSTLCFFPPKTIGVLQFGKITPSFLFSILT